MEQLCSAKHSNTGREAIAVSNVGQCFILGLDEKMRALE
jgi:hypothetical protein